jgi:hypothetical protein
VYPPKSVSLAAKRMSEAPWMLSAGSTSMGDIFATVRACGVCLCVCVCGSMCEWDEMVVMEG